MKKTVALILTIILSLTILSSCGEITTEEIREEYITPVSRTEEAGDFAECELPDSVKIYVRPVMLKTVYDNGAEDSVLDAVEVYASEAKVEGFLDNEWLTSAEDALLRYPANTSDIWVRFDGNIYDVALGSFSSGSFDPYFQNVPATCSPVKGESVTADLTDDIYLTISRDVANSDKKNVALASKSGKKVVARTYYRGETLTFDAHWSFTSEQDSFSITIDGIKYLIEIVGTDAETRQCLLTWQVVG